MPYLFLKKDDFCLTSHNYFICLIDWLSLLFIINFEHEMREEVFSACDSYLLAVLESSNGALLALPEPY